MSRSRAGSGAGAQLERTAQIELESEGPRESEHVRGLDPTHEQEALRVDGRTEVARQWQGQLGVEEHLEPEVRVVLLAGVGILLVGALFFFGGDDDKAKQADNKTARNNASAQTARANGKNTASTRGGVAGREADNANQEGRRPKPKLNPAIGDAVVGNGMGPSPKAGAQGDPDTFESKEDEITYWEDELREANRMLEIRERAVERIPKIEEKIRNGNDPEGGLIEFEKRKEVVRKNLEKAQERVEEVEGKLEALGG